jgi:hypothetical protein
MRAAARAQRESTAAAQPGSLLAVALERAGAAGTAAGGGGARSRLFDLPPGDRDSARNAATIAAAQLCSDEDERWWLLGVAIGVNRSDAVELALDRAA